MFYEHLHCELLTFEVSGEMLPPAIKPLLSSIDGNLDHHIDGLQQTISIPAMIPPTPQALLPCLQGVQDTENIYS